MSRDADVLALAAKLDALMDQLTANVSALSEILIRAAGTPQDDNGRRPA